jgi:hypothetical protein
MNEPRSYAGANTARDTHQGRPNAIPPGHGRGECSFRRSSFSVAARLTATGRLTVGERSGAGWG